jgi:hypothetical protein
VSTKRRPSISTGGVLCTLAVLGAGLVLPASAGAAPTCPDVEVSVHHDTSLPFDSNPCTGGTGTVTLAPATTPEHGTLSQPGGVPTYTPNAGFVGTDSFDYTGADGTGTSEPATVTVHVTDAPPTCQNTSTTTRQDTAVDINDLFVGDDADDTDWFFEFLPQGQHGHADDEGTTYTPDPGFVGTDQIVFRANDGALTSDDCTITITVKAKPVVQQPPPQQPVVPVTPVDTTRPVFSAAHPKQSIGDARKKGIKLTSSSNEAGTLVVTIKVDKKTARKLKLKRKAKRAVTVGILTQSIAAGKTAVTVKLTKKARKAFKRARKVKLLITMTVTDAAGNATTRSMTVTLKR